MSAFFWIWLRIALAISGRSQNFPEGGRKRVGNLELIGWLALLDMKLLSKRAFVLAAEERCCDEEYPWEGREENGQIWAWFLSLDGEMDEEEEEEEKFEVLPCWHVGIGVKLESLFSARNECMHAPYMKIHLDYHIYRERYV